MIWTGSCLSVSRQVVAISSDIRAANEIDVSGQPAWERALLCRPPLPGRKQSQVETFRWKVKPASLPLCGRVYTDGSFRDNIAPELGRGGWSVVVVDECGRILGAAFGVPPP